MVLDSKDHTSSHFQSLQCLILGFDSGGFSVISIRLNSVSSMKVICFSKSIHSPFIQPCTYEKKEVGWGGDRLSKFLFLLVKTHCYVGILVSKTC